MNLIKSNASAGMLQFSFEVYHSIHWSSGFLNAVYGYRYDFEGFNIIEIWHAFMNMVFKPI